MKVYSVDKIYWLQGWKNRDEKSFHELHNEWIGKPSWIIEGVGYFEEMKERLAKSDLIIFLDVPISICKERAKIRVENERFYPNTDITKGCSYGEVQELQMKVIENFHKDLRPRIINILAKLDKVQIIRNISELKFDSL